MVDAATSSGPGVETSVLGAALWAGSVAGLRAAVAGLGLVLVPVLVVWLAADGAASAPTTGTGDGWWAPVRAGGVAWLLAHGAHLRLPATVDVVPLGLTALAVALVALSSRRVAGAIRARPRRPSPAIAGCAAGGVVAGYLAAALVLLAVSTTPAAVVPLAPVLAGTATVAAVGAVPVLLGRTGATALLGPLLRSRAARAALERLPRPWRLGASEALALGWLGRVPRAALVTVAALALPGAALVAWVLVRRGGDVVALSSALDAGTVGTVAVVLAQVALLPVAVVWGIAWLAGPGFAVGAGTSVTLGGSQLGAMPALPVLAALEGLPASFPAATWAALVVPVLAGALGGRTLLAGRPASVDLEADRPSRATTVRAALLALAALVGVVGVVAAVALAASSGGVGPGRMTAVGPPPWSTLAALSGEVLLGAALVVLPSAWRRARGLR